MFGTNAITKNHLVGAAVGVGVAAVAFYLYKKNQAKGDEFLIHRHNLLLPQNLVSFKC